MATFLACLSASHEKSVAFMAGPPDTLPWLFVNKVLATGLTRSLEHHFGLLPVPVHSNRGIFLVRLDDGRPLLTASNKLSLGALRRIASAFDAAEMLAIRALLG